MTKRKIAYQWFVEPKNALTNESIAEALAAIGQASEVEVRTDDGFGMYRVKWALIRKLYALHDSRFAFAVHNRVGRHGQLRDVTAETAKFFRRKPSAVEKKAKADLENIKRKRAQT